MILKEIFLTQADALGLYIWKPYTINTVFGEIMAVNEDSQFSIGDQIVFKEFSGGRWSFNGEKMLITPEKSIIATLS